MALYPDLQFCKEGRLQLRLSFWLQRYFPRRWIPKARRPALWNSPEGLAYAARSIRRAKRWYIDMYSGPEDRRFATAKSDALP